jgi:hypothetical protein
MASTLDEHKLKRCDPPIKQFSDEIRQWEAPDSSSLDNKSWKEIELQCPDGHQVILSNSLEKGATGLLADIQVVSKNQREVTAQLTMGDGFLQEKRTGDGRFTLFGKEQPLITYAAYYCMPSVSVHGDDAIVRFSFFETTAFQTMGEDDAVIVWTPAEIGAQRCQLAFGAFHLGLFQKCGNGWIVEDGVVKPFDCEAAKCTTRAVTP